MKWSKSGFLAFNAENQLVSSNSHNVKRKNPFRIPFNCRSHAATDLSSFEETGDDQGAAQFCFERCPKYPVVENWRELTTSEAPATD